MRAALLLLAVAVAAQVRETGGSGWAPFAVTGTVAVGADVEVVLLDQMGSPVAATVATAGGRFQISVRDPGHYRLAIRQGRQFYVLEQILLSSGEPVVTVHAAAPRGFEIRERPSPQGGAAVIGAARLAQRIPKKARRLYEDAVKRRKHGDDAGAVERLEKALTLAPDYLDALNDLAVVLMRQRKHETAEAMLRRAIAIDPAAWQPRLNLGILLLDQRSYQSARAELEKARSLGPGSPLPDFHLGRLNVVEGRGTEAEACFDRVLEAEPHSPTARLFRGYARIMTGRLRGARDDLAAYLEQAPEAPEAARVRRRLAEIDRSLQ